MMHNALQHTPVHTNEWAVFIQKRTAPDVHSVLRMEDRAGIRDKARDREQKIEIDVIQQW